MRQQDWEALLDKEPEDWVTRLVYADWLEEQGDEASVALAQTQRWMATHKKYANYDAAYFDHGYASTYDWWLCVEKDIGRVAHREFRKNYVLDEKLFRHLPQPNEPAARDWAINFREYPTRELAELHLCMTLLKENIITVAGAWDAITELLQREP